MPSLNATPVNAANSGPIAHTAAGWCATYKGTDSCCVTATPTDPINPTSQSACMNFLIGSTYMWIKWRAAPRPAAPAKYAGSWIFAAKPSNASAPSRSGDAHARVASATVVKQTR